MVMGDHRKSKQRKLWCKWSRKAMWQIVQSIEQCLSQQEKNSDLRLATMFESERKRDELFLNFQR